MRKEIKNEVLTCDCCGRYINDNTFYTGVSGLNTAHSIQYKELDICSQCHRTVLKVILDTYGDTLDIPDVFKKSSPFIRSTVFPLGARGDLSIGDFTMAVNNEK